MSLVSFARKTIICTASTACLFGCGSKSDSDSSAKPAIPAATLVEKAEVDFESFKAKYGCQYDVKETRKGLELKNYTVTLSCPTPVDPTEMDKLVTDLTTTYNLIKSNVAASGATLSQGFALDAFMGALRNQLEAYAESRQKKAQAIDAALSDVAPTLIAAGCGLTANHSAVDGKPTVAYIISCRPVDSEAELSQRRSHLQKIFQSLALADGSTPQSQKAKDIRSEVVRELGSVEKTIDGIQQAALNARIASVKKVLTEKYQITLSQGIEVRLSPQFRYGYSQSREAHSRMISRLEAILNSPDSDLHFKGKGIAELGNNASFKACSGSAAPQEFIKNKVFSFCMDSNESVDRSFQALKILPTVSDQTSLDDTIKAILETNLVRTHFDVQCRTLATDCLRILKIFLEAKVDLKKNTDIAGFGFESNYTPLQVQRATFPMLYFSGKETDAEVLQFLKVHFSASPPRYSYF